LVRFEINGNERNQMFIVVSFLNSLPFGIRKLVKNQLAFQSKTKGEETMFQDLQEAITLTRRLVNNHEETKRPLDARPPSYERPAKRTKEADDSTAQLCRHCLAVGKRVR
jgi:hypothetical protein